VLLLVTLAMGIGIGIRKYMAVRMADSMAKTQAEAALTKSLRDVPLECRTKGHAYVQHATGWQCATCGGYMSPHEGELYGLASEGRIERRRHPR
jgi:hypothetical protein